MFNELMIQQSWMQVDDQQCGLNTLIEFLFAQERLAHATIDEELSADPQLAKEIDEEIRQGDFIA